MASPLGNFGILPPELREIAYGTILPRNFRQVFNFDSDTGVVTRRSRKCHQLPGLAQCSKKIRDEMSHAMMRHCVAAITVTEDGMFTNFPTADCLDMGENVLDRNCNIGSKIRIPMCTMLLFTIRIASPRDAEAMLITRNNVKIAVNIINRQNFETLPKIQVQLEQEDDVAPCYCSYNDFAIFAAPFADLRASCADFAIIHPPRHEPCNWKVANQCEAIERAVRKGATINHHFHYQQLMHLLLYTTVSFMNAPIPAHLFRKLSAPARIS